MDALPRHPLASTAAGQVLGGHSVGYPDLVGRDFTRRASSAREGFPAQGRCCRMEGLWPRGLPARRGQEKGFGLQERSGRLPRGAQTSP